MGIASRTALTTAILLWQSPLTWAAAPVCVVPVGSEFESLDALHDVPNGLLVGAKLGPDHIWPATPRTLTASVAARLGYG